ncbi:MAG: arginase [Armatimonadota bacterium]|nr:arginase [Armatimonadota bacterium]MDR5697179.1 arginase [Armatimonadota bacterium]
MARIGILGVPLDLGSDRRGTDMGPSAIRYARLRSVLRSIGHEVVDYGNVSFPVVERLAESASRVRYADAIVAVCEEVDREVAALLGRGAVPVILGGDHSLSLGTMAAVARHRPEVGLLWLDAHGDFNTPETSPTGNVHGMVLAALVGRGDPALGSVGGFGPKVDAARTALVGVRDLDPPERTALREAGVAVFTMRDVDERGVAEVMREALRIVTRGFSAPLHLSVDLDVVDPMHAPGVATPAVGGLSYREAHLAMEIVAESGALASLEAVEVNPVMDTENRTARLATELIASALGKRIL